MKCCKLHSVDGQFCSWRIAGDYTCVHCLAWFSLQILYYSYGFWKIEKLRPKILFPKMWWFFFGQTIIHHMLIKGKKLCGYLDEILLYSWVKNGHSNEKISERNILVFLLNSWSMATTWSVMNWCSVAVFLIGIGFTCKKNFRKIFQKLLDRKPKHFCDQGKCSTIQVFHTFPGISQNLPKNVSIFS